MKRPRARQPSAAGPADQPDIARLVEAASFKDVKRDSQGRVTDHGTQTREQAILALGELPADAGNGTVIAALRDPVDSVRSAAVRVLYARQEGEALADALGWLPVNPGRSRNLASRAVLELRSTPVARAAARALVRARGDEPLSDTDIALVHALVQPDKRHRPAKGVIRELLNALGDERPEVTDRAEEALIRLAPMSTPSVIGELESGRSPEHAAAILGRIGDPAAMQALILALAERQPDIRVQAAAALGALHHPAAVKPLLRATWDSELDVRVEASQALDRMGVVVGLSALLGSTVGDAVASAVDRPVNGEGETAGLEAGAPSTPRFVDALKQARAPSRSSRGVPGRSQRRHRPL